MASVVHALKIPATASNARYNADSSNMADIIDRLGLPRHWIRRAHTCITATESETCFPGDSST